MHGDILNDAIVKRRTLLWHMGERYAANFLVAQGWTIISQNWKAGRYEIDIIALTPEQLLVFVEVKTRITSVHPGVSMYGLESITYDKRQKLVAAANIYLHHNELVERGARLDVIVVSYPRKEKFTRELSEPRRPSTTQPHQTVPGSRGNLATEGQAAMGEFEKLDERRLRQNLEEPFATHIAQAFF